MKFSGIHWKVAVLTSVLFASTSAINHPEPYGLHVGDQLPKMNQARQLAQGLDYETSQGRYTLICFWASYDAKSRAQNKAYHRLVSETISDKITYKAISLDREEEVYQWTLQLDKLDGEMTICPQELTQELSSTYRLDEGLQSYLVDNKGSILSINPSVSELEKFYLL